MQPTANRLKYHLFMQTIGERLEEARKRKGISLREAAEATKIRGDFLSGIEQDNFDYDLPDIYKNGFVKNYARYLKLDPDKALTDFQAQQLSKTRLGRKGGSELFGTMDLKKAVDVERGPDSLEETPDERRPVLGRIDTKTSSKEIEEAEAEDEPLHDDSDKIFYIKAGLIFAGTLAFVIIVFGLIKAILGGGGDEAADSTAPRDNGAATENATPDTTPPPPPGTPSVDASSDELTLEATGNVYVIVKQKSDNSVLFRDTLGEGDTVPLSKEGPVEILFTAGENLIIESGGERMRPSVTGTAKITVE